MEKTSKYKAGESIEINNLRLQMLAPVPPRRPILAPLTRHTEDQHIDAEFVRIPETSRARFIFNARLTVK